MRTLVWRALEKFEKRTLAEPAIKPDLKIFPARANAVHMIHFPENRRMWKWRGNGWRWMNLRVLQFLIQSRREKAKIRGKSAKALACGGDNRLMKPFLAQLGFKLTEAQTKVLREIRSDMGGAQLRGVLLQGDVISGKTVAVMRARR